MNREWLAFIEGIEQGPYTAQELSTHPNVTPDTLVKKKLWVKWIPIRQVFELRDIFKDKLTPQPLEEELDSRQEELTPEDSALVISGPDPFFSYVWWILAILFLISLFYFIYE